MWWRAPLNHEHTHTHTLLAVAHVDPPLKRDCTPTTAQCLRMGEWPAALGNDWTETYNYVAIRFTHSGWTTHRHRLTHHCFGCFHRIGWQQEKNVNRLVIDVSEAVIKLIWPHPTATMKKKHHSSSQRCRLHSGLELPESPSTVNLVAKLTKEHINAECDIWHMIFFST